MRFVVNDRAAESRRPARSSSNAAGALIGLVLSFHANTFTSHLARGLNRAYVKMTPAPAGFDTPLGERVARPRYSSAMSQSSTAPAAGWTVRPSPTFPDTRETVAPRARSTRQSPGPF